MAVTETANKAPTALVSKGAITAPAAVGECEISVESPVPLPHGSDSKTQQDTELPNCCRQKEEDKSKLDVVVGHFKLQTAPAYPTLVKLMSRQAAAVSAPCGNGARGTQTPQQWLPQVHSGSENASQRAATAKLLFHFHVSGTRLQGMSRSERDSTSKLDAIKDWECGILFPPLPFRKKQITENSVSHQGHLTLGRQDGSLGALLSPTSLAGGRARGPPRHRGTGKLWAMALYLDTPALLPASPLNLLTD